jgi:hypothetical protein
LIDWDASFNQLLNSVQRQSVEMIPYEQTGLQRIARFSEETAKGSAFQSLLVVQPASRGESEPSRPFLSEPADASRETQWQDFSTYSIIVECQLESDRAHFLIDFDSSVIGREQMECISQHLTYTISQLSKSKLGDQSLRSLADNQWDLNRIWTWNAVVPQSTEMCVHDLFSQRVSENPSATAISAWDGDLTYGQLDALSTNLAHQLSAKGIAKTIVPLVFGKSCLMPVAALAVIKAGGACVAVDTKQPPGRLSAIIAQANSSIILSSEQNEVLTRQLYGKMKDIVIVGPQQSFSVPVHSKLPFVSSSDTLYLVFTSGSTGTVGILRAQVPPFQMFRDVIFPSRKVSRAKARETQFQLQVPSLLGNADSEIIYSQKELLSRTKTSAAPLPISRKHWGSPALPGFSILRHTPLMYPGATFYTHSLSVELFAFRRKTNGIMI